MNEPDVDSDPDWAASVVELDRSLEDADKALEAVAKAVMSGLSPSRKGGFGGKILSREKHVSGLKIECPVDRNPQPLCCLDVVRAAAGCRSRWL